MKAAVLIGAVFVVILVFFIYFFDSKEQPYDVPDAPTGNPAVGATASSTDSYDAEVVFTGESYEPAELQVKKGTRVRFVNNSDTETWPASAVHPTHSLYPEKRTEDCLGSAFDACRGLKKGEFFSYTFNYVGEWRYHDHNRAYYTGTIFVNE